MILTKEGLVTMSSQSIAYNVVNYKISLLNLDGQYEIALYQIIICAREYLLFKSAFVKATS